MEKIMLYWEKSPLRKGFCMKRSYFSRDISDALKGIALILMFIHHFFTFPDWITCGVEYPWIESFTAQFCAPTDICVCLFAFLTGYFYAFSRGTLGYSLKKITDFLLSYWLVCIPMIALAVLTGCYTLSKAALALELLGLQNTVMTFCWYVNFFCIILLALPLLTHQHSRSPVLDVLVVLVVPTVALNIWVELDMNTIRHSVAWNLRQWYPCVALGWLFGKYGLFEKWFDRFLQGSGKLHQGLVCALMVWFAFRGRYYIEGLYPGTVTFRSSDYPIMLTEDVIFAPLFLYGGANLLMLLKATPVLRVLEKIGQKSMLMWFYHCIFFNCCKGFTQIVLYFPRNPLLVLLNGLVLCYAAAAVTDPVRRALLRGKDALLRRAAGFLPTRAKP